MCADEATVLLDCSAPRRRGRLPRDAITDVVVADTDPKPIARLFKFDERFFRLRRG